jgi:hypothetical protein
LKREYENHNGDIEKDLNELPDLVSAALEGWRIAREEKRRFEALLRIKLKAEDPNRTSGDLKALVDGDDEGFKLRLVEIKAEAEYTRLYEKLMSAKKSASLRTAF